MSFHSRRLEMAFHFRQVEIGTAAAREQHLRVVEEIEGEVEDRSGDRRPVDENVGFDEVPAARAHEKRRGLLVQAVVPAFRARVLDGAVHRVAQIHLSFDHVGPGRRVRVLEIRHEYVGAAIQRVDHHLAVGRAGDFDAAVLQVARKGRDCPFGFAYVPGLGQEIRQPSGVEFRLSRGAHHHQLATALLELARELRNEGECRDVRISANAGEIRPDTSIPAGRAG
jgi:hypothetical protein